MRALVSFCLPPAGLLLVPCKKSGSGLVLALVVAGVNIDPSGRARAPGVDS